MLKGPQSLWLSTGLCTTCCRHSGRQNRLAQWTNHHNGFTMPSLPPAMVLLLSPFALLFDASGTRCQSCCRDHQALGRRTVSTALYVLGLQCRQLAHCWLRNIPVNQNRPGNLPGRFSLTRPPERVQVRGSWLHGLRATIAIWTRAGTPQGLGDVQLHQYRLRPSAHCRWSPSGFFEAYFNWLLR